MNIKSIVTKIRRTDKAAPRGQFLIEPELILDYVTDEENLSSAEHISYRVNTKAWYKR